MKYLFWTLVSANLVEVADFERLKEENRKLSEANLIKNGETTILRADLQNLRTSTEKREAEKLKEISSLRKQVQEMNMQHSKQLEATKTELKFKVCFVLLSLKVELLYFFDFIGTRIRRSS